jgi:hypothetical protein
MSGVEAPENPLVGAYWSARKETRGECAARIVTFLHSIAFDPMLSRWCHLMRTSKSVKKSFEASVECVEKHLRQNHTDIPRRPIPQLGFSLGVWNCDFESSVGFSVTCGCYSTVVGNAAVLTLPRQVPPGDAAAMARFRTLVEKAAVAFDPEVAVATSSELNARGARSVRENPSWIRYERGRGFVA